MSAKSIAEEIKAEGKAEGEIEASINSLFIILAAKPDNRKFNKTLKSILTNLNDLNIILPLIACAAKSGTIVDFLQESKLLN
jgi:hypothetical protein